MRFDIVDKNDENKSLVETERKQTVRKNTTGSGSILELLNPLKSVNINSDLHSFYNFRESKESVEALLKAQTNLVFYVVHQNFMCDEAHKEFFKNMIGRFYDVPENLWDYYQGYEYIEYDDNSTLLGLVLLENKNIYEKHFSRNTKMQKKRFAREIREKPIKDIQFKNRLCLEEYWGGDYSNAFTKYFEPFNNYLDGTKRIAGQRRYAECFKNPYEYGRFKTDIYWIKHNYDHNAINFWYKISFDELVLFENFPAFIDSFIGAHGLYASLGLENFDKIINTVKDKAKVFNKEFNENWIPKWTEEDKKMIRSLSQTFNWTKDFIYNNEELLDLDVLGLNMSVPWDIDLVKFFIRKGFGGRMSENKAVFDKVFKPLLTDAIVEILFNLEYPKYK